MGCLPAQQGVDLTDIPFETMAGLSAALESLEMQRERCEAMAEEFALLLDSSRALLPSARIADFEVRTDNFNALEDPIHQAQPPS